MPGFVCDPNFAPGWGKGPGGEPCCEETCHENPGGNHLHCTIPPKCQKCPPKCPWDLDGDGFVTNLDADILLALFGPCPAPCPPSCPGDFDGNCVVDAADLAKLLGNIGLQCP